MTTHKISGESARTFIRAAFLSQGFNQGDADVIAAIMTDADLQGSDGHGIIRLPQYIKRVRANGLNKHPELRIVRDLPATALLDGDNGMGHLVVSRAVDIVIEKARTCGTAWVNTRRSNHAGPASLYVQRVVEAGLICLYFAVGNANHLAPWGGLDLLLSTNPIAVGIPTQNESPVILDMATTVAAYGKVKAKAKRGEMMPPGWMIDRQGQPLLDPARSSEGLLLPIGGHKGYGLSLVVGLLAGTLGGAAVGREVVDFNADFVTETNTGQAIVAVDPAAFGDIATFRNSVDHFIRDIRESERLPGVDRIWLPGEQSHERRKLYARTGFPMPDILFQELNALGRDLGLGMTLETFSA